MDHYHNQVRNSSSSSSFKITSKYFVLAPSHSQEVILIVNKREESSKTQQTPNSTDETTHKVSTVPMSPKPIRQRERSGVETDDDELLAQIQKLIENNSGIGEEELLKEKIIEARLIAQCKFTFFFFIKFSFISLFSKNNL